MLVHQKKKNHMNCIPSHENCIYLPYNVLWESTNNIQFSEICAAWWRAKLRNLAKFRLESKKLYLENHSLEFLYFLFIKHDLKNKFITIRNLTGFSHVIEEKNSENVEKYYFVKHWWTANFKNSHFRYVLPWSLETSIEIFQNSTKWFSR